MNKLRWYGFGRIVEISTSRIQPSMERRRTCKYLRLGFYKLLYADDTRYTIKDPLKGLRGRGEKNK